MSKQKKSRRPQDQPQTKLRIASRRARLLQLFSEGKSTRKASMILKKEGHMIGASQQTVSKDLVAMRAHFEERVPEERERAYQELKELKRIIAAAEDMSTGEFVSSYLAAQDRLSRLLGLDAATKSVSVKVDATTDPKQLVGYRRFLHETRFLDAGGLEKVFAFAKTINVRQLPAEIMPPTFNELSDETLQLTEGEQDEQ